MRLLLALTAFAAGLAAPDPRGELAQAMRRGDLPAVQRLAAQLREALGEKAGQPEVAEPLRPIPPASLLTPAEARTAFTRWSDAIARRRWWRTGLDPTKLDRSLREPASVAAAAARQGLLPPARDAAEFLLWAQARAGVGLFPFPAARGVTRDNAFVVAGRFLDRAERDGRLAQVTRHGWLIDDLGDGGLQYDNGEAGAALVDLYEVTNEHRYLEAARRAADWALAQPCVPNWNYNAFSVWLLARVHAVTREPRYRAAAKSKALLGLLPGQLTSGPRTGRWADPHNARAAYHFIILRALTALAAVLPPADGARPRIVQALRLGLTSRNRELLTQGAANKDGALEVLVEVHRVFANDPAFLSSTSSSAALQALGQLVSQEYRDGQMPTGPRPWAMFLTYVGGRK